MPTLRDLLNRLRWDARDQQPTVIAVRVREGREEHIQEIEFARVTEILPRGVTVAGGTFLPYHRFVAVRRGTEVLWPIGGG